MIRTLLVSVVFALMLAACGKKEETAAPATEAMPPAASTSPATPPAGVNGRTPPETGVNGRTPPEDEQKK